MRTVNRGPDAERLGARLRDCRHAVAMSQAELEQLTGIPKARLSRYENGHVIPSVPVLTKLAYHLHSSVDELLKGLFLDR
jgi:transcriptional regulator with XRE-family HTH domain